MFKLIILYISACALKCRNFCPTQLLCYFYLFSFKILNKWSMPIFNKFSQKKKIISNNISECIPYVCQNPSSDRLRDAFMLDNMSQHHNNHTKLIPPTMPTCNANNSNNTTTKIASTRSTSLELILTPIIQSSRR